jgi:subtilisin family serine protease
MRRIFLMFIMILLATLSVSQVLGSTQVTPASNSSFEGFNVIDNSIDMDNNKIHDSLDESLESKTQPVDSLYIHYDHLPLVDDVTKLDALGINTVYRCKYIKVIETSEVYLEELTKISALPGVTFIEPTINLKPLLDVSARAVKARESTEYSPSTAWELGYSGNGITIAILDTGVDDGHPSLEDKFVAGVDFVGAAGRVTPKDGSYNPDDDTGHGTAIAGVAMGTGGDNEELRGIAPDAKLIDVRVSLGRGGDLLSAFEWCIDNKDTDWNNNGLDEYDGIDVVSLSVGGDQDSDGSGPACQLLNQMVDSGMVVVVAIGNDGPNNQGIGEVAAADKVITVGNLNIYETINRDDDEVHYTSTMGPRRDDGDSDQYDELKPDVVAPGISIAAPSFSPLGQNGDGYENFDGSSYSCPHVSGICALMLEANSNLKPRDIKNILHQTAEAMGEPDEPELSDKYNYASGFGSVDAYEAVNMAIDYKSTNSAPIISSIKSDPKFVEPNGEATITTSASDPDGDVLNYEYTVTSGAILGTGSIVTWMAPAEVGDYDITVVVNDGELYSTPSSVTITVETEPGNHAPVIESVTVKPEVVEPGGSVTINTTASDPDDDDIFYEYSPSGGKIIGTGSEVVWVAPEGNGKYTISITVTDGLLSAEQKVQITVEGGSENQPPEIESFIADTNRVEVEGMVHLFVTATDPEQSALDYFYFAAKGTINGAGPYVDWLAPDSPDLYEIEVTVTDNFGLFDTKEILIEVFQPNVPPEIKEKRVFPTKVENDGTVEVLLTVTVDDKNGLGDIDKVVIDLTSIFGSENQKMNDNGKFGDQAKFDGVYSVSYLVPEGVAGGRKVLPFYVRDLSSETTSDNLLINITAVAKDDDDKGFFDDLRSLPGFEGELAVSAILLIIILLLGQGFRPRKTTDKT